ncbi:PEGA domain-containing protein [candidate division WOR-3 bacterium]|nr:PEGA domain-containing protein [candidate division WOR-3 bacterium]
MYKMLIYVIMIITLGVLACQMQEPCGAVEIMSTPQGACVTLDGDSTGKKTYCALGLVPVGEHTVGLAMEAHHGLYQLDTVVTVEEGEITTLDVVFFLTGSLSISSVPSGADVYLDGDLIAEKTDCILPDVPAGEHDLVLSLSGYEDWDTTITIAESKTTLLNVTLISPTTGSCAVNSIPFGTHLYLGGNWIGKTTRFVVNNMPAAAIRESGYCGGKNVF